MAQTQRGASKKPGPLCGGRAGRAWKTCVGRHMHRCVRAAETEARYSPRFTRSLTRCTRPRKHVLRMCSSQGHCYVRVRICRRQPVLADRIRRSLPESCANTIQPRCLTQSRVMVASEALTAYESRLGFHPSHGHTFSVISRRIILRRQPEVSEQPQLHRLIRSIEGVRQFVVVKQ